MPEIRRATLADIDSILAMQRTIHAEHLAWDTARWTTARPLDDAYRAWILYLVADQSNGLALVATSEDRVAGYLIAEVEPESTKHWSPAAVYLHDLFVDPSQRRTGIARELMNRLLQWAAQHHPRLPIRLITAACNESGRAFFERVGFRSCAVEMIRE